jgi:nitroreductase
MEFMDAVQARWACKLYDETSPVDRTAEDLILEAGRLAPSAFGLEHWRFVSVRNADVRRQLFTACLSQDAIRTAPLIVVILVRRARFYLPDADFTRARSARFPGGHPVFRADYLDYYNWLRDNGLVEHWARAQAYLACANMLNAAASIGVDSCAIEGYREDEVLAVLTDNIAGFDPVDWRVGIISSFGLAAEPRRQRIRQPLEDLVLRL